MLWVAPLCAVAAASLLRPSTGKKAAANQTGRPPLVEDALLQHKQHQDGETAAKPPTLYYFGVGSNLLRSKIEGRGINGTNIEIASMQPAFVRNHRLAFNMKGFAPLEPGMGSLEPVGGECGDRESGALLSYRNPVDGSYECHGALVELTVENYAKIMASEGVGIDRSTVGSGFADRKDDTGYEEVVVTAIPYDGSSQQHTQPIQAIALRAKPGSRLKRDPCPSRRYMSILREGAAELGLKPCYQDFLQQHPTQYNPRWLKRVAIYNMMGSFPLFGKVPRLAFLRRLQTTLLWAVYVPTVSAGKKNSLLQTSRQFGSHVASAACMAPLAFAGVLYKHLWTRLPGKEVSPMLMRFVGVLDADDGKPGDSPAS